MKLMSMTTLGALTVLVASHELVADETSSDDDIFDCRLSLREADAASDAQVAGDPMSYRSLDVQDSSVTLAASNQVGLEYTFEPYAVLLGAFQDDPDDAEDEAAGNESGGEENLAEKATNPIAPLFQLQFQNNSVFESNAGDGYSNSFVVQPVIPYKIGDQALLTRITLPLLVATPDLGDPIGREYGLGDTVALNAMTWKIKEGPWAGMWGPILTLTFPTASSDFTGQGKWQAGPGFIYINTATKGLQWGLFGYQQWSYASSGGDSDRPEVSQLFFQPIVTKHFDGGWYIALQDILWSIDWNDNARWSLPTGLRFGRVSKWGNQQVNAFIEPYYDLSGNNTGNEWGIKFNVTMLFPQ